MGAEFIDRVLKTTAILTSLGFLFTTSALGIPFGVGFLASAVWSALNLWLLTLLIRTAFAPEASRKKVLILFLLKFPLLYGCGFLLVVYGKIHILGALVGFSLPLIVIILKSAGQSLQSRGVWNARQRVEAAGDRPAAGPATKTVTGLP